MKTFEELDALSISLLGKMDTATDLRERVKAEREYHKIRLEMVALIDTNDEPSGISARRLIYDVSNRDNVPRYETGITPLDQRLNGGIEVGTFIQLAGQSFAGKTHLVLEILSNISSYKEAVFFNFEMGDVRIAHRLKSLLKDDAQLDNLIIDSRTRDIDRLVGEIKIYAKKGIKFFAVDSKMKITSSEKDDFKRFGEITSKLSRVAQENDVIVFLINQMNEEDIKNNRLAFKGSGDQMYDTDIALFYKVDKNGKRKLVCPKNRQDENEFSIDTVLSSDGKTIEAANYDVETTEYNGGHHDLPSIW